MNELPYIDKWLRQTLVADVTLEPIIADRVFNDDIPNLTAFPLIKFNFLAGRDVPANGTKRLMTRPLYLIRAIVKGSVSTTARDIADRLDDIVQNTAATVFEGFVFSARREQPFSQSEKGPDQEIRFHHLGGIYRIDTQKA